MSRVFEFYVPEDPPEIVVAERLEAIAADLERIADAVESDDGDELFPDGGTEPVEPIPRAVSQALGLICHDRHNFAGNGSERGFPNRSWQQCYDCRRPTTLRNLRRGEVMHHPDPDSMDYEWIDVDLCPLCWKKRYGVPCGQCGRLRRDQEAAMRCCAHERGVLPDGGYDHGIVGECIDCGGRMIEHAVGSSTLMRTITLVCQDCHTSGLIRYEVGGENPWQDPREIEGVTDTSVEPINWIECANCHGSGWVVGCIDDICHARGVCMHDGNDPCPECHTSGQVPKIVETDGGKDDDPWECPQCGEPHASIDAKVPGGCLHCVDLIRYIEYEAPGMGMVHNDVSEVVCFDNDCEERVPVDPHTLVVEDDGLSIESEEYDPETGQTTGYTAVEIYCSIECRNNTYSISGAPATKVVEREDDDLRTDGGQDLADDATVPIRFETERDADRCPECGLIPTGIRTDGPDQHVLEPCGHPATMAVRRAVLERTLPEGGDDLAARLVENLEYLYLEASEGTLRWPDAACEQLAGDLRAFREAWGIEPQTFHPAVRFDEGGGES